MSFEDGENHVFLFVIMPGNHAQIFHALAKLVQHFGFSGGISEHKSFQGFNRARNQFIFSPEIEQGMTRSVFRCWLCLESILKYSYVQITQLLYFSNGQTLRNNFPLCGGNVLRAGSRDDVTIFSLQFFDRPALMQQADNFLDSVFALCGVI